MKCPKCRTDLPVNANACVACGTVLQAEVICSKCNHVNPPAAGFCLECGHSLTEQSPTIAPPESTSRHQSSSHPHVLRERTSRHKDILKA